MYQAVSGFLAEHTVKARAAFSEIGVLGWCYDSKSEPKGKCYVGD